MCQGAERVKKARVQTLKSEFESMHMKDAETLDDFYLKLNGLVTNIRSLGEEIQESYVVKKLLRAVPSKFLQIVSIIEQFGNIETMSVEEAIGSLKAHEERTKGQAENNGTQLLLTEEEWSKRENGDGKLLLTREEWIKKNRGKDGGRGIRDKSRLKCYNCGIYGHFAGECRKPKKEKEQKQEMNMTQIEDDELSLLLTEHNKLGEGVMLLNEEKVVPKLKQNGERVESNLWYLDNGASNHMTGLRSKFRELNEGVTGQVHFGDGSTVEIKGKGSVDFTYKNGEEHLLDEVYYIPMLCNNVISLGQLSESGNKVVINGDYLWVFDKREKLLMKVKRSPNRLYKIDIETSKPACLALKVEELSWLWHSRLGHVNFQALTLMHSTQMVCGLPKFTEPEGVCTDCLMSKQVRSSFPSQSKYCVKQVLELVHGDLCGPISPATSSGNKYFFLLVDDYSRIIWVYLLKSKDEALNAFKKFKTHVEKESDKQVKTLRTDHGGEFCSLDFTKYCEENVIARHLTTPYTPQQNRVVERRNRTVVEMARSLLKQMKLPLMLWGEAGRHSVYLLNRLPTRSLTGKTPYEAWKGEKPNIGHIRIFGCLAHMKVPGLHTKKLDDRSKIVVHLGREPGTKGYRLYDPESNKIYVSRDVVFEEEKTWPWNQKEKANLDQQTTFTIVSTHAQSEENELSSHRAGADSDNEQQTVTPQTQKDTQNSEAEDSSGSSEPKKFRSISDIYNETEEIELDDELLLMGIDEPRNYSEAAKDRNWRQAIMREMESVEQNNTWKLTDLPTGHKMIGLKWIFKLKRDANGKIVKYKARIVAKGYVQEHGVDFDEIFALVTRIETVRLLLALAAKNDWEVHHLDVKTTFLNGDIQEEVYVAQPEGFVKKGQEHLVYRLIKAFCGLHQAPRAWYAKLNKSLEDLGFTRCPHEHAVYVKREGGETLIIGVYVDDLLIMGTSTAIINKFKQQMSDQFEMNDLGKLSYYLGMEVHQRRGYIELKQAGYAKRILEKAGMEACNPIKFPMDPNEHLNKDEGGKVVDPTEYKSMVGGLRYLVHTRPDIAYAVGIVSRFMEKPTILHKNAVKRILRYVKGMLHFGLVYSKKSGNNVLTGYSDSDLGGQIDDRRSIGGMSFYLNENLITWISKKQRCVALSLCEAEFMAATATACQAIWLKNLLSKLTGEEIGPVTLYIDNRSAIDIAKNPVFHGRSKHIDIRYHFIRECVERKVIVIKHVNSDMQRADTLTKALTTIKFEKMRRLLGMKDLARHVSN